MELSSYSKAKVQELLAGQLALSQKYDTLHERILRLERVPVPAHVNSKLTALQSNSVQCQATIASTVSVSNLTTERVAKLEATVAQAQRDLLEIKTAQLAQQQLQAATAAASQQQQQQLQQQQQANVQPGIPAGASAPAARQSPPPPKRRRRNDERDESEGSSVEAPARRRQHDHPPRHRGMSTPLHMYHAGPQPWPADMHVSHPHYQQVMTPRRSAPVITAAPARPPPPYALANVVRGVH